MGTSTVLAMAGQQEPSAQRQLACQDCRWAKCRFRVSRVRSYLIAYREARKYGDDPAEYIRDSIKPSRRPDDHDTQRPETTDALIRGTAPRDPLWHVDIKIALEQARDLGGLSFDAWNAERVAKWLCARAAELPVDSDE